MTRGKFEGCVLEIKAGSNTGCVAELNARWSKIRIMSGSFGVKVGFVELKAGILGWMCGLAFLLK